jgi:hypothetical protein
MRKRKIIKALNQALKKDYLYNEDELKYMKTQLKELDKIFSEIDSKNYKGFGKKYETNS